MNIKEDRSLVIGDTVQFGTYVSNFRKLLLSQPSSHHLPWRWT